MLKPKTKATVYKRIREIANRKVSVSIGKPRGAYTISSKSYVISCRRVNFASASGSLVEYLSIPIRSLAIKFQKGSTATIAKR